MPGTFIFNSLDSVPDQAKNFKRGGKKKKKNTVKSQNHLFCSWTGESSVANGWVPEQVLHISQLERLWKLQLPSAPKPPGALNFPFIWNSATTSTPKGRPDPSGLMSQADVEHRSLAGEAIPNERLPFDPSPQIISLQQNLAWKQDNYLF